MKSHKKVVVIGGGFSGLATAALLAKEGFHVTLLEKNRTLGGRARVFKTKGFSFDMGPSWYLMPEVFEKFFAEFGKKPSDYYTLERLDPRYKVFFGDETSAVLSDNIEQNSAWFESQEIGAGKKLRDFLERMKQLYELATQHLLYEDLGTMSLWTKKQNLKDMVSLVAKFKFWDSWHHEVAKYFKNPKLQQVLSFSSVFLGGSPFNTPALYSMLAWADFGGGVWYPKGGMGKVVAALESLATEHGVKIVTGTEATAITVHEGEVTGVTTKSKSWPAEVVIGACDLPMLETQLLSKAYQSWDAEFWKKQTLGISSLLLYLGVSKRLPAAVHHNLFFSPHWKQNFGDIFDRKVLPKDPSFYISIRSVTDRSIVPKDSEEIVILVPLAAKSSYSARQLEAYADDIIKQTEKLLGTELTPHLVVKEIYAPQDFVSDYHAYQGTALGLAHTLEQSLWGRPGNRSLKVKGLYYVGQFTNPGIGVPMTLISAQIVSQILGSTAHQAKATIFKNGSVTYYYSSLFFKGQTKLDVFTLYAYVRVIDDLVDVIKPRKAELEKYWTETQTAWKTGHSSNQVVNDFIALAKRHKFEWNWIEAFWKSMRWDLEPKNYQSFKDLEEYMYGSAEVIGLMMSKILGLPKAATKAAQMQGKAMQLLNFIRDVKEDHELGRNYLGYDASITKQTEAWSKMLRSYIEKYWQIQAAAAKGYKYIPREYLIPIKTAADMYAWTAKQIHQNPMIVWDQKIKPNRVRVMSQLFKNTIGLK